jgi:hypothetical protein
MKIHEYDIPLLKGLGFTENNDGKFTEYVKEFDSGYFIGTAHIRNKIYITPYRNVIVSNANGDRDTIQEWAWFTLLKMYKMDMFEEE